MDLLHPAVLCTHQPDADNWKNKVIIHVFPLLSLGKLTSDLQYSA